MTQQQLAYAAGVHRVTVAEIEGGRPAEPDTIRVLAKALGVKPTELMEVTD